MSPDGGRFAPDFVIEKMVDYIIVSTETYRELIGKPIPWTVAEWEAEAERKLYHAQPWRRFRRWFWAALWDARYAVARRIYPFREDDDD